MSGVVFLLVISLGLVTLIGVANLAQHARGDHEAAGLYGQDLRRQRLETRAFAGELDEDECHAELRSLAQVVAVLDRVAFHGIPLERCVTTGHVEVWSLTFRDDTVVILRALDRRALERASALAAKEPVVVGRVHPFGNTAVVELTSPRHRPVRVAVRA